MKSQHIKHLIHFKSYFVDDTEILFCELIINNKSFVFNIPRNKCPSHYISSIPLINVSFTTDDEEFGEKVTIFTPIMKTRPFGNN
jgi:hypothetical protein